MLFFVPYLWKKSFNFKLFSSINVLISNITVPLSPSLNHYQIGRVLFQNPINVRCSVHLFDISLLVWDHKLYQILYYMLTCWISRDMSKQGIVLCGLRLFNVAFVRWLDSRRELGDRIFTFFLYYEEKINKTRNLEKWI